MTTAFQITPGQTVTFTVTAVACSSGPPETPAGPPFVDRIAVYPTNPHAQNPISSPGRWATGRPTGVTIHHTGTTKPLNLARFCLSKRYLVGGVWRVGLPTSQYHIFIHTDGTSELGVPLDQRLWHDHGGYPRGNISIGMAEYWHERTPPTVMIDGLARVAAWLMREYDFTRIESHHEVALRVRPHPVRTPCPGWHNPPNGAGWKPLFDEALALAKAALA
jgi:hypothetical protein